MAANRSNTAPPRFNKEYFGFLVGYPSGDIVLANHAAEPLLETGAPLEQIRPFLIEKLDVREGFHLSTPPLVWLELTRECNLRCPHCYIDGGLRRNNEMSTDDLHLVVDDLADMGVWAVALTGGEPTMHPNFVDLVTHARDRGLLVGVATNGLFLTDRLLEDLPNDGVIVSVSLDGLHLDGREGKEFEVVTDAIARAQEAGFHTNIMTNTTSQNLELLARVMKWAKWHKVSVRSVPFSPLGRGKAAPELENSVADVQAAAEFWMQECEWEHEYHSEVGLCVGLIFNFGLTLAYMSSRCSSGRFLAYICADGTVYPCTMCAGEQILSPGRLQPDRRFSDIWRSEWEIRKYSWANFAATCNGCPINRAEFYCSSRCPAMSHARNQELFGCGASDFEIASTVVRSAMLETSSLSKT